MSGPRFSIIPAGAVTDRSLEPRDLQTLCLLGRHTDRLGWCVRSQVRMAQELDCSRSSVQRSLDRLYEAGWVEKKRRDLAVGAPDVGQPSSSYAYRVKLDRDDVAFETVTRDAENEPDDSYAETASEAGGCPPVGTPNAVPDGHPGAQPYVGTGAQPYVGTKNVPLERTPIERERDARAKDRKARFLVSFEARWPTAAADDRQRTAYAADALTEDEHELALAGIGPFLENLKRFGRKNVPAGWRYLEEKRWTLLDTPKSEGPSRSVFPRESLEANAIVVLHDIAGKSDFLRSVLRQPDGGISYLRPMTDRLRALAQAPPPNQWIALDHQQAGAWEGMLAEYVTVAMRHRLREGARAPWPWPPRKDGTLSPDNPTMTEHDVEALATEGTR